MTKGEKTIKIPDLFLFLFQTPTYLEEQASNTHASYMTKMTHSTPGEVIPFLLARSSFRGLSKNMASTEDARGGRKRNKHQRKSRGVLDLQTSSSPTHPLGQDPRGKHPRWGAGPGGGGQRHQWNTRGTPPIRPPLGWREVREECSPPTPPPALFFLTAYRLVERK